MANNLLLTLAVLILYALHQDVWFWRTAHPLVFGFLPIGLAWHGAYCVAVALLMWRLIRVAWPGHLEDSGPAEASPYKPYEPVQDGPHEGYGRRDAGPRR